MIYCIPITILYQYEMYTERLNVYLTYLTVTRHRGNKVDSAGDQMFHLRLRHMKVEKFVKSHHYAL